MRWPSRASRTWRGPGPAQWGRSPRVQGAGRPRAERGEHPGHQAPSRHGEDDFSFNSDQVNSFSSGLLALAETESGPEALGRRTGDQVMMMMILMIMIMIMIMIRTQRQEVQGQGQVQQKTLQVQVSRQVTWGKIATYSVNLFITFKLKWLWIWNTLK